MLSAASSNGDPALAAHSTVAVLRTAPVAGGIDGQPVGSHQVRRAGFAVYVGLQIK